MPLSSDEAASAVSDALDELQQIVSSAANRSPEATLQDFDRWKRRTATVLASSVSAEESSRFARIASRPNWVRMEPIDSVFNEHGEFLAGLVREMVNHPIAVQKRPATSSERPRRNATRAELELPAKVTLHWLVRHVPISFWFWFGGIVVAAVALGVKLGQEPAILRIVGPLLGISLPGK